MFQIGDVVEDITMEMTGFVVAVVVVMRTPIVHVEFFGCEDEVVGVMMHELRKVL
jgi:hypothetical protein